MAETQNGAERFTPRALAEGRALIYQRGFEPLRAFGLVVAVGGGLGFGEKLVAE